MSFRLNDDGFCSFHANPKEKTKVSDLIEKEVPREELISKIGLAFDQALEDQGFSLGEQTTIRSHQPIDTEDFQIRNDPTPPPKPQKTIRIKEAKPPKREKKEQIIDLVGHPEVQAPKMKPVLPKRKRQTPLDPEIPSYSDYEEEDPLAPVPPRIVLDDESDDESEVDEAAAQYYQSLIFNTLKWLFQNGVLGQLEKSYPERYKGIGEAFASDQYFQENWNPALSNLCSDFGIKLYNFRSYHLLLGMTAFKIATYSPPKIEA